MKNLIAGGLLLVSSLSQAADIDVYRDPSCGCCHAWIEHLEENGLEVNDHVTSEVVAMKQSLGVDPALRSCHTAIYKGVFIEGHVPASDVPVGHSSPHSQSCAPRHSRPMPQCASR
jgi:hypothetical protein